VNNAAIRSTWRGALAQRRLEHHAHLLLEREIAEYHTPAERLEIQAIIDRYPVEETMEIRRLLIRQAR